MLRSGSVDGPRTKRALEAIFNNATRQGRLIEELLDVSRIVAGRATLDIHEMDLGENIRGAVEAMMPSAAAKDVAIQFEPPAGVTVLADPRRLEQVFMNLLSNAVKFTPANGRVAIDVAAMNGSVTVRVADTGAGIDPAFLPHVFDRFRQADSTTTRSVGGLGLGLFIARHLVEAQEGTIDVASEGRDRGAVFTVTLKAASAHPVVTTSVTPSTPARTPARDLREVKPALMGVRVLVVDDEADSREMMTSALESCGATVVAAASATEALRALNRRHVDVLLSDVAMPDKDGYELIREVRLAPTARIASVPAAAVTACVREDEKRKALAEGFQMHLAKPVHPTALAKAVAALARRVSA
jgi:CheY-like chemotaxis protein/anti-sigma regulatory factor (Ser/Thr protein kinase)